VCVPAGVPAHHSALCTLHTRLRDLRNLFVSAIPGTKVENGGPVVGEVFGKLATRAGGKRREVMCLLVHGHVEGVLPSGLGYQSASHLAFHNRVIEQRYIHLQRSDEDVAMVSIQG
jgi:hypothetical protein